MASSLADAPSSFPATQQDPPTRAQPLEDVAASLLLLSEAPNPQGRAASVQDFDLKKDESPKTYCTTLLSPDSSNVQVHIGPSKALLFFLPVVQKFPDPPFLGSVNLGFVLLIAVTWARASYR